MSRPQEPITLKTYHERALAWIRVAKASSGADPCLEIEPNTPEWSAWETYFRHHLGGIPLEMKNRLGTQTKGVTVPAKWPEWFDGSYRGQAKD